MDNEVTLKKILRQYEEEVGNNRTLQGIAEKMAAGKSASYRDAEKYARGTGKALTRAMRAHLPEVLDDGRLYRATAEVVVEQPMIRAGKDVGKIAAQAQKILNQKAGIGMNAIIPELNQDQITGIITGICNAPSYEHNVDLFMDQVAGFLEGHVDDFVHDNADFQSKAGLTIFVERYAYAKCCEWCNQLAGTYRYEDVSDRGNDVWKRHNNCHCQIVYDPTGSKRRR